MKAIVISLGGAMLLAGCGAGEQQQIENGIRAQLATQGNVLQLAMTRQSDGQYAGTARVRTADGQEVQLNCTARREGSNAVTSCAQVIDQALIQQVEAQVRTQLTARGVTVTEVAMARQDDNMMTGHAVVRDPAGTEQRINCTAPRDPATNRFNLSCEAAGGASASAPQAEGQTANPAPQEPAAAEE